MNIEYSKSLYNSQELKEIARAFLKHLPDDVDCLLSSGSSGCALASAMLALSGRPLEHRYIHRNTDVPHSRHGGYWAGDTTGNCAIVDDFISTGETIERIADYANRHYWKIVAILVGCDQKDYDEDDCPAYQDLKSHVPVLEIEKLT